MQTLISFVLLLSLASSAFANSKTSSASLSPDTHWLETELTKMGLSKGFIKEALEIYEPENFDKVLTLNLLGFLRPPGEHMDRVTPEAVRETAKFVKENQEAFDAAKDRYKVPANVIAALLWIETRHGSDTGDFHTLSVYLHLLQTNRAKNRAELTRLAIEKNKKERNYTAKALRTLMAERTKKKYQWAKEQLIALAAIRKEKNLDLKELRGSYAGAFGLPQFIPSSYRAYAKSLEPNDTPNLDDNDDAIVSVAYYLSKSGWKNRKSTAKVTALMKYNNSRDYADAILEISKRATRELQNPHRSLSSTTDNNR